MLASKTFKNFLLVRMSRAAARTFNKSFLKVLSKKKKRKRKSIQNFTGLISLTLIGNISLKLRHFNLACKSGIVEI